MRIEPHKGRVLLSPAAVLLFLFLLSSTNPGRCVAEDLFPGYAPEVRSQATRVVEAAGRGKKKELANEVRRLRKRMYAHGILSMNAIPDLVFRRAEQGGWEEGIVASFRVIAEVSPFSVQMWAWMVKEDILRLRPGELVSDFQGMWGALRGFGPALLGHAAWVISFGAAAVCWFVVWVSIALFLRARPSLELDIARLARLPKREYLAPLAVVTLFLLPLGAGLGLAVVVCYWMVFSVAYLRRGELMLMTTAIFLLATLFLGGSMLHLLHGVTGDAPKEGWLGADGYIPKQWPAEARKGHVPVGGAAPYWLVEFSRARAAMQGGNHAEAERNWTELIEEGKDLPEVRNNRGITRAKQGRMEEALSDFEAAFAKRPEYGPALWNAYQAYLQAFNLERARVIQPLAWDRVARLSPFRFHPADMEAGEWLASPLPVGELIRVIGKRRGDLLRKAGEGEYYRMFFRPLTPETAPLFLILVWLCSVLWKFLSLRVWVQTTCRGCGAQTLVVGIREATDFCNMCHAKVGWGIRAGEEKERRALGIRMHRNYVRAASVLVPGSGGLWSGKEILTMVYVVLLSLSLAVLSSSLGAREGGDILSKLQSIVARWAALATAVFWAAGAAWGIRSFGRMQRRIGITGEKR
ncbi:MAG: tetratricopeptide repeat protein [Candidatus Deferrimicrobiaceae bacterium]